MAAIVRIITVISAVFLFVIKVNVTAKDTLRLGVLIPVKGDLDLSAYIPTMELALETVANDTTLPFNFSIIRNDSMVSNNVIICVMIQCTRSATSVTNGVRGRPGSHNTESIKSSMNG